jgi:hypothetical protein
MEETMAETDDTRERRRAYRRANPEKVRKWKRAAYAVNREALKAKQRAYNAANRERSRAVSRAYYIAHPLYGIWSAMLARCFNPKCPAFKNYGGRGITVCERWHNSYPTFEADMLPTRQPGFTIERIDNDGPYSPENCCWTTRTKQNRNRRDNVRIDTPDGPMGLAEAAERFGFKYGTFRSRYHRGEPLFAPLRKTP